MDPTPNQNLASVIGAAVRAARQRLDITQAEAAGRIGVATEVYGRLERGHMLPSVRTLRKLCLVLNCSSDWVLGLNGDPVLSDEGEVPEPPPKNQKEIRRLMKTAQDLEEPQLRLVNQVACALKR